MEHIQSLIVALAVVVAAIYATWRLAPASVRLRLLSWLDARLAAAGGPAANGWRERLILPLLRRAGPAGACGDCSAARAPTPPRHPAQAPGPSARPSAAGPSRGAGDRAGPPG